MNIQSGNADLLKAKYMMEAASLDKKIVSKKTSGEKGNVSISSKSFSEKNFKNKLIDFLPKHTHFLLGSNCCGFLGLSREPSYPLAAI